MKIRYLLSCPLLSLFVFSSGCGHKASRDNVDYSIKYSAAATPEKPAAATTISVNLSLVDIVPAANSAETNQDSEPNLTVNPLNPDQIVASAFTPGPFDTQANFCPRTLSPVYVSTDAGRSWVLNCIVPTYPSTFDISVRFGPISGNLYAGILSNKSSKMLVLRTTNVLDPTEMSELLQRDSYDQPYIEVARSGNSEAVYVGENNCCTVPVVGGRSANIDQSFNALNSTPSFAKALIETRETLGFDLASVRVAVHQPDNAVFAIFMGTTGVSDDQSTLSDVVIVRDDHGGSGILPYTDLKDKGDGLAGLVIEKNLPMPPGPLGQQRLNSQSHISVAVDPRAVSNYPLYIAWVDRSDSASSCTLHVRRSNDKGHTWAKDLRTYANATNPALAVNADGIAGLLYQQFVSGNWETHFEISADQFSTVQPFVLSKAPDASIPLQFDPYIGDYAHLLAVGRTFYGIFSANNTPDRNDFPFLKEFPSSLTYQRYANFDTHLLSDRPTNGASVQPSIDPFFLEVTLTSPPQQ